MTATQDFAATRKLVDSFGRTPEQNAARMDLIEKANEEARANWDNPQWRHDFAQDLTESILLGFNYETLIGRWIESETTDFTGRIFVKETTGLKAFYMARGGYIEASEMTSEISELPRDMIGVHVWEFEDRFLSNFAESAQTLRDLAVTRMDAEVNRRVHTVLTEAVPSNSPYYIAAPGLDHTAVNNAIRSVRDASLTGQVAIVGRSTMVDQILDFPGYGQNTLDQIVENGFLGRYRGVDILSLRNWKDEDNTPFLPANEMWIIANDTGKFGFFGGLQSKEFSELDNWYWHYLARRDSGVLVHHPERARRFVDTSQSA